MRQACLLICSFLLLSCQTSPDLRHILKGDIVSLNKAITFPELQSHIIIQFGEMINERDLHAYDTSCSVDNRDLGPKTIQPQSYRVTKVTYNEEMYSDGAAIVRYFTEIYLDAADQHKDIILTCQVLGDTMQHHSFPLDEIRQATGDYFIF